MRDLSDSEAKVIGALLASDPGGNRVGATRSALPLRTFESIVQRAYDAGWVFERYVPNPVPLGTRRLHFALSGPDEGVDSEVLARWAEAPTALLCWRTPDALFGVWAVGANEPEGAVRREPLPDGPRILSLDLRTRPVPIYFDYEGAWATCADLEGVHGYPRGLPDGGGIASATRSPWPKDLAVIRELVGRSDGDRSPSTPPPRERPWLRFGHRRQSTLGAFVQRRIFLDPGQLPRRQGWRPQEYRIAMGRLKSKRSPEALLSALTDACQLRPFLYATNGRLVLFGLQAPRPQRDGVPDPAGRPRVVPIVKEYLDDLQVVRMPLEGLVVTANHRYDRLLLPPR